MYTIVFKELLLLTEYYQVLIKKCTIYLRVGSIPIGNSKNSLFLSTISMGYIAFILFKPAGHIFFSYFHILRQALLINQSPVLQKTARCEANFSHALIVFDSHPKTGYTYSYASPSLLP